MQLSINSISGDQIGRCATFNVLQFCGPIPWTATYAALYYLIIRNSV